MAKNDLPALRHVWLAFVLLTRLPLPRLPDTAFAASARAVWAYPLVGLGIGLLGVIASYLATLLGLGNGAAAGFALAAMICASGAMHEDGLADCADGFWGATDKMRRLEIMRDSQIGTYGVLALLLVTGLRWQAIMLLLATGQWPVLLAAAALSRANMPLVMAHLPHARRDGLAHSVGRPAARTAWAGFLIGAIVSVICMGLAGFVAIIIAGLVALMVSAIAIRKIGGQTGDVLGATQQLGELAVLLTAYALLG